jgi:type III pantothenate kinase
MTFLIDIGNTAIKWGVSDQQNVLLLGKEQYERHLPQTRILEQWKKLPRPSNALISNVASSAAGKQAQALLKTCWSLDGVFVEENQQSELIKPLVTQNILGVDRWLALLFVHQLEKTPFAIVGCGTAITLDICIDGQHVGGLIAPGIELMRLSLEEHTAGCRLNPMKKDPFAFMATDTDAAMRVGTLQMGAAFIEGTFEKIERALDLSLKKIITGGDADRLLALFKVPQAFIQEPALVLKGLALFQRNI